MDDLARAGAGASPDDDEFTVAQDTEFDEPDMAAEPADGDDRTIDDSLDDELPGLDTERRVDLSDEAVAD